MNWKLSLICLTLSVMACGVPVLTESPESVNKAALINTPKLSPAPVPTVLIENATVCGNWNVRAAANPNSASIGIVLSGSPITLTGVTANAPNDGGQWVQIRGIDGTGWMNAKGLCHD